MFGKKGTAEELQPVPVFTVPALQRPYEEISIVYAQQSDVWKKSSDIHRLIIEELGKAGARAGGDAVIAFSIHSQGVSASLTAYGTAVRYLDKKEKPEA